MADDSINDFLLDQELEGDPSSDDNDLPDDIDAILDAVEEEDLNLVEPATDKNIPNAFSDETALLDDPIEIDDPMITEPDLEIDLDLNVQANPDSMDIPVAFDSTDNIPLISDIIDPNAPGAELNDSLSFELMAKIQTVVEQAISKEVGRITATLRDNVIDEVKNQLPAVISKVLKSKK
ncbi:MAG: hypothetical protein OEX12_07470 [Gammaproteobacteria bacterium]|nr:hypothetical protein [Gammaproteobacteria bacterium]